jgi:hypothetical protein
MVRKDNLKKIEFTTPATIDELITALLELRTNLEQTDVTDPGKVTVRTLAFIQGMSLIDGSFVRALVVD